MNYWDNWWIIIPKNEYYQHFKDYSISLLIFYTFAMALYILSIFWHAEKATLSAVSHRRCDFSPSNPHNIIKFIEIAIHCSHSIVGFHCNWVANEFTLRLNFQNFCGWIFKVIHYFDISIELYSDPIFIGVIWQFKYHEFWWCCEWFMMH